MALLLHQRGIQPVVIDRLSGESDHPKAHFINMRTMEVLREINPGLSAHVASLSPPQQQWRQFIYCSSMLGPHIATFDHFAGHTPEHRARMSAEPVVHLAQPKLVTALLSEVRRRGIDVRFGHQFESSHSADGTHFVRVHDTATSTRHMWQHRFVVGADGANSAVRHHLGIDMEGNEKTHAFIGVHFHCPSLLKHVQQRSLSPGMLFFIFNEHTMGVVVAHDMAEGNYVYQIPYFPPFQNLEAHFSPSQCQTLVQQAIGAPLDLRVHSARAWRMTAKVAST
jgi:2-polyprenyl-6-methoxyphenol hydroxylase-like FAD-dependent oxidoreductase